MDSCSIDDNIDRCSLCGKPHSPTISEKWYTEGGELIEVPISELPYALLDTAKGKVCICEECYKKGNFKGWKVDKLAELHEQFGQEYQKLGCFSESIDALQSGLRIKKTADLLNALALTYSEMGEYELERKCYLQALELEPNHFAARVNLKNMKPQQQMTHEPTNTNAKAT